MVAFVTGSTLGLSGSSLAVIGANGVVGDAQTGSAGERVYVNVATGDLVVQRQDEFVESQEFGQALSVLRTYNSYGQATDGTKDGWQMSVVKTISGYTPPSNINSFAPPATIYRNDGDGTQFVFTNYDSATKTYTCKSGAGAFDTLTLVGTTWVWRNGTTGATETYDVQTQRMVSSADREGNRTYYAYDAMGRLTTKSVTIGIKTFTISYGWGDAGSALDKLTSITYPSGNKVNYSYAANGMISGITVNAVNPNGSGHSGTAQMLLSAITYNVDARPRGWLWSDGKARTIGYDSYGQIASYTLGDPSGSAAAAGVLRTVQRDAAGRITGYTHTNNAVAQPSLDQSFGYDNLDRLTSHTLSGTSYAYSYDATGNRTAKTIGGTTYTNTVAATSNRYTLTQDVTGTATINHDSAGNVTGDGANTYAYSDRGRMASSTTAGGSLSFRYNGLEQRASKTNPSGTSYYVYDEAGQLLGEYDQNGSPIYETVYLNTTPVGALKQTGTAAASNIAVTLYNVHADQIETPRIITQQDHQIVWRWDTAEAFGATGPDQNPSLLGAFAYNPRFPGQVFDQETGLNQNWNREYNARWGRYAQSDPIGLAGGVNTYAYVSGSPLMSVDPKGLQATLPGPGGIPIPVPMPTPGVGGSGSYDPKTDTWNTGSGGGSIIWPPGYSPDPQPTTCHIEVPSTPPPLPPKNDCESQLKVCTGIARSYPSFGMKTAMMAACFVQYAICKKVFNHE